MSSKRSDGRRARARAIGLKPGILPVGPRNDITDVAGVFVGHTTLIAGDDIRTGATAILPHGGNLFQEKVPAGLFVGNGFGKLMGSTQVQELGELETPIVLTNTLAVPRAADAILNWTLVYPGNEEVTSVNPLVGETNDGFLNNIRRRVLTPELIQQAIQRASDTPVVEGCVGAGTGTVAFSWKGGIGSSSRRLPPQLGGFTVGVLVQSNFGGVLQMGGIPVGQLLGRHYLRTGSDRGDADGSIMIVIATNAPLSPRALTRLAARAMGGLARTGASLSNGSGDYAIAFSTARGVRVVNETQQATRTTRTTPSRRLSPLFQAVIEATEEAIYNSLLQAETMRGQQGRVVEALPLATVQELVRTHGQYDGI